MDAGSTAWLSALWLGVLTSISPCPLAANIAAVSYVARTLGVSIRTLQADFKRVRGVSPSRVVSVAPASRLRITRSATSRHPRCSWLGSALG